MNHSAAVVIDLNLCTSESLCLGCTWTGRRHVEACVCAMPHGDTTWAKLHSPTR